MIGLTQKERVYLTNRDLYKIQVRYCKGTGNQEHPLSVTEFIELEELDLIASYFRFLVKGRNGSKIICDNVGYYIGS